MVPSIRPQQDKYQNIYFQYGAENANKNSIFSISIVMVSMFVPPPPKNSYVENIIPNVTCDVIVL